MRRIENLKEFDDIIKHIEERRTSYREMGNIIFQEGIEKKDLELMRLGELWNGRADALDWLIEWIKH